jgi:hypothetical protein
MTRGRYGWVGATLFALCATVFAQEPQGVTYKSPTGVTLRLMLDETNLGSELSLGR